MSNTLETIDSATTLYYMLLNEWTPKVLELMGTFDVSTTPEKECFDRVVAIIVKSGPTTGASSR
jgi:hypothetical protein